MIGLGNAFRLPGLQKFLQEKLQLEVRKCQKLERATGESVTTAPTFAENILSFGVAYGLALQGLKKAKLQTNLLPYEVRLERVIRGKKPWAVAAAASLLIGMSILALARGMESKAVYNEDVKGARKIGEDADKAAGQANSDFGAQEQTVKESADKIRKIASGVTERPNWMLLHQYVNLATPQPDGKRLPDKALLAKPLEKYWTQDPTAKEAFAKFEERRTKQKEIPLEQAAKIDAFIKKNLIQINIAGTNALYTDDFGPYFQEIGGEGKVLFGMNDEEQKKVTEYAKSAEGGTEDAEKRAALPKDGWLVEIRGYTYHKAGKNFVKETIVANLMKPNLKPERERAPEALKDLEKRVQERVSFLLMYKNETDDLPEPGKFNVISKSFLSALIRPKAVGGDGKPGFGGGGANVGALNPMGGGKDAPGGGDPLAGGGDPAKPNRDTWTPIGEIASSIFGQGGGGFPGAPPGDIRPGGKGMPMPPMPPPNKMPGPPMGGDQGPKAAGPAPKDVVPRTEFVILFIWREPIVAGQPTEEKKD
jgi:hypothetical protein